MNIVQRFGETVVGGILAAAGLLRETYVPGVVAVMFVVALVLMTLLFLAVVRKRAGALKKARAIVERSTDDREFRTRIIDADAAFEAMRRTGSAGRKVAEAWYEYRETNVSDEDAVRNALRPGFFFNLEDMGLALAGWRIVPGLFVSMGLALTFVGLISALHQIGEDIGSNDAAAMKTLMTIAPAKFIMSLAGLVCSILFTIVLRRGQSTLEDAAHSFAAAVERRSSFLSLEDLSRQQLEAIRDQKEHMQKLNTELIAELGRPLREEIPAAISSAIAQAIGPVVDRVGQVGSEGLGDMVRDLSKRFSADVGEALGSASARLGEAGDRIGVLAQRMDESSGRMGQGTEAAISGLTQALDTLREGMARSVGESQAALAGGTEQMLNAMNGTLERIRENTAANAEAMRQAATEMRASAEAFRDEMAAAAKEAGGAAAARVEAVGDEVVGGLVTAAAAIAEQAKSLSGKAHDDLLAPLEDVRLAFERISGQIATGSERMERFSDRLDQSTGSAERAAEQISSAARGFADAAEPIKAAGTRIEQATGHLAASTSSTAQAMREHSARIAGDTEHALRFARETLGGERNALTVSLKAIDSALERFEEIAARHDQMDAQLGQAFSTFRDQVQRSVAEVQQHADKVHQLYTGSLDTLREVMDQAETFVPERKAV